MHKSVNQSSPQKRKPSLSVPSVLHFILACTGLAMKPFLLYMSEWETSTLTPVSSVRGMSPPTEIYMQVMLYHLSHAMCFAKIEDKVLPRWCSHISWSATYSIKLMLILFHHEFLNKSLIKGKRTSKWVRLDSFKEEKSYFHICPV